MKSSVLGIVGLAFGEGPEANKELGSEIYRIWKNAGVKTIFILQKEISDLLPPEINKIGIGGDQYLNTYEVLKAAKEEATKRGISDIILIAHPAQLRRAKGSAKRVGFTLIDYPIPKIPWPKHDPQKWVRGPLRWWLRELFIAWPYFKFKGWM